MRWIDEAMIALSSGARVASNLSDVILSEAKNL
jgi:hypothetical protein